MWFYGLLLNYRGNILFVSIGQRSMGDIHLGHTSLLGREAALLGK
jgi:hypothetical protein